MAKAISSGSDFLFCQTNKNRITIQCKKKKNNNANQYTRNNEYTKLQYNNDNILKIENKMARELKKKKTTTTKHGACKLRFPHKKHQDTDSGNQ